MDKWHSLKDEDKDLFPLLEVSLYVNKLIMATKWIVFMHVVIII